MGFMKYLTPNTYLMLFAVPLPYNIIILLSDFAKSHRACISMRELSMTAVIEIFANWRKTSRRSMPTGVELCFIRSIQSMTAVIEIFANRRKASRRSMPTGVELSQTTVCEIFALAKTDRPAGRFNRRQQSASYAATAAFYRPAGRFNRL